MFIKEKTLDDLMYQVFKKLLKRPFDIKTTRGKKLGSASETIGNLLILENPLARLSLSETRGKPFSALGELFWYLSKSNDLEFIEYYIQAYCDESEHDKNGKEIIYGGYGPRLFDWKDQNQIDRIIKILIEKSTSRKAVIQLFDASDLASDHHDITCTCSLQFLARKGKLNMHTSMRSNDAFLGLPHDIFSFTMLQEIIAKTLSLELGTYYHSVGSLHLYEKQKKKAEYYINEGLQSTKKGMPKMPEGDPWKSIKNILSIEPKIRKRDKIDLAKLNLDSYWQDLVRLLQIHSYTKKRRNLNTIAKIRKEMASDIYDIYIENKLDRSI